MNPAVTTRPLPASARTIRSTVPTSPRPRRLRRLGHAVRRVFTAHAHEDGASLPAAGVPEHLTRSAIRDEQIRRFGFHARLC